MVCLYSFFHGQTLGQSFKAESEQLVLDIFGCWLLGEDVVMQVACGTCC